MTEIIETYDNMGYMGVRILKNLESAEDFIRNNKIRPEFVIVAWDKVEHEKKMEGIK
jgi:hypothetical protein